MDTDTWGVMVVNEEQPSVAAEPEMLSDGSGEFLSIMAFILVATIVIGIICGVTIIVAALLRPYG